MRSSIQITGSGTTKSQPSPVLTRICLKPFTAAQTTRFSTRSRGSVTPFTLNRDIVSRFSSRATYFQSILQKIMRNRTIIWSCY